MSESENSSSSLTFDINENAATAKSNLRGERKARKMLSRYCKKIPGEISRVVFRLEDGTLFAIDRPDVYKNTRLNTFIVFGCLVELDNGCCVFDDNYIEDYIIQEAAFQIQKHIESLQQQQQQQQQQQAIKMIEDTNHVEIEEIAKIDETGLNDLDIELVMSQAGVTREKAVLALRQHDNDLVNTIMDLVD